MVPLHLDAGVLTGLTPRTITLPEYDGPYEVLEIEGALRAYLPSCPLVAVDAPDLRARVEAFRHVRTRVTHPVHSQPPHRDHPHRPGDPRRYACFWAETPRAARTFFLDVAHAPTVATRMTAMLRGNRAAHDAASYRIGLFRMAPHRVTRYLLPGAHVDAFERLVEGEGAEWAGLSPIEQTTVCTRLLGNTRIATELTVAALDGLPAHVEDWSQPRLVFADDTRLLHGRLGEGESGEGFYRIWLVGV